MTEENLPELQKFKLACIDVDNFTDDEISKLAMAFVLSADEVEEFCLIIKKYRPNIYYNFSEENSVVRSRAKLNV